MLKMQDEKTQFEENQRAQFMVKKQTYDDALNDLHKKQNYNQDIVKDHLELKHVFELEERAAEEENEIIRQQNLMLRNTIRSIAQDKK